jgi:hypothetical protein
VGYVGAPLADDAGKGLNEAQVLPGGLDHNGTYDPADFGLTSLFDKTHDAFVLPATSDGDPQPRVPAVTGIIDIDIRIDDHGT